MPVLGGKALNRPFDAEIRSEISSPPPTRTQRWFKRARGGLRRPPGSCLRTQPLSPKSRSLRPSRHLLELERLFGIFTARAPPSSPDSPERGESWGRFEREKEKSSQDQRNRAFGGKGGGSSHHRADFHFRYFERPGRGDDATAMWGLFWALLLLLRLELPLGASPEEQCRQNTIGGVEGKDIALHPNVSGSPAEITWMKDGNIVATSIDGFPTKNNLELIVNNGSLILHNLSLKDVGCYKAEIEVKDEVTETFFGLKVLVPPSLTCSTNDSIQISCNLPTNMLDLSPSYEWKGFEKDEIIHSNWSFVQLHKNIDPSKKITCIVTAFNVNVSNSINLNECIWKDDPMPSPEGGNISDNQPDVNLDSAENLEGSREESSPPES
uniref:Uncharacterized protein isoform X3 n=1 Tax=Pogona vitticeps TaxID=103695 RepID=A0ABM5FQX7_9SAUR